MGSGRAWTAEEIDYLSEKWGSLSVKYIATRLNRSTTSIQLKAGRLGLGPHIMAGEYMTMHQLFKAMGRAAGRDTYNAWLKRGLPVRDHKIVTKSVKVIYIDQWWQWAGENRNIIDWSRMEEGALGKEPVWVADCRRQSHRVNQIKVSTPWTQAEDDRLKHLVNRYRYTYKDISQMMCRSEGAIEHRCGELGLMARPLRVDSHASAWTEKEFEILADGIRSGKSYQLISREIAKTEKAIRGKVYYVYLTESQDKIRKMIGQGPWGHGAPEVTVGVGWHLSRTRRGVRRDLETLHTLLATELERRKADDGQRV